MQRPTSVTVFGILNILFSLLRAFGSLSLGLMLLALSQNPNAAMNPFWPQNSLIWNTWQYVVLAWSALGAVLLLVSGIGLLRLVAGGRRLAVGVAQLDILFGIIGIVIQAATTFPKVVEQLSNAGPAEQGAMVGALVATIFGPLFGLIYPLLIWFYMTRPHVLAAFAGNWQPGTGVQPAPSNMAITNLAPPSDNPFASPVAQAAPDWAAPAAPEGVVGAAVAAIIPAHNGAALWAYYLGLFSLFPLLGAVLGPVAVWFGLRGLANVRRDPKVRGGIHAWVGLICGALFGLFNALLLVMVVLGVIAALTQP